jgi:hypothetical protein
MYQPDLGEVPEIGYKDIARQCEDCNIFVRMLSGCIFSNDITRLLLSTDHWRWLSVMSLVATGASIFGSDREAAVLRR